MAALQLVGTSGPTFSFGVTGDQAPPLVLDRIRGSRRLLAYAMEVFGFGVAFFIFFRK